MTYYTQGAYKAQITGQGFSNSSTGKPQFWLQAKILESLDNPNQQLEQYDRTIYWTITDGTIEFVIEKLERLGFRGEEFKMLNPESANFHSFVGQEVELYCKLETWEGSEREKWDLSRPQLGANVPPLDDAGVRQLDALFGKKLKEKFRTTKPAAKKQQPAKKPEYEETLSAAGDEIPF